MKVVIIGSGYVGLVAAVGFAEAGHQVLGVDVDAAKVEKLKAGISPIYEPGLDDLLLKHQTGGLLRFTLDLAEGIGNAIAAFICVGTPQSEDGSADLHYVLQVAEDIGKAMQARPADSKPLIVVDKSTVPVGTALRVTAAIQGHTDRAFEVVSNPEFLREGCAIDDFLIPDRVVIGCRSDHAAEVMRGLYQPLLDRAKALREDRGLFFRMDPPSAEMTKYTANAMLALRISFMNEIAGLCETVGANVEMVRDGIGSDHRIGKYFLNPGPGFGGSCFPKDLQALLKTGREHGHRMMTLATTVEANRHQKQVLGLKVKRHFGADPGNPVPLAGRRFALLGLAFKAHTDDIREAMSLELIDSLVGAGAAMVVHDFEAMDNVRARIKDRVAYAQDPYAACEGADAVIIATEWPQYKAMDLDRLADLLKSKLMFDGRNLFQPADMQSRGWTYHSIGRLPVNP